MCLVKKWHECWAAQCFVPSFVTCLTFCCRRFRGLITICSEYLLMKIICVGRNYADHIAELNNERPSAPVIFLKPETAQIRQGEPFFYPDFSNDIHHEVELVVKINRVGKNIEERFAHKYYDEIGVGIDFTARDLQSELKAKGLPWELAKAFNGSAPVSEFVPVSDFEDIQNLNFNLDINGETRQEGNSSMMLYRINYLISFVSRYFMLKKGDQIFTGTPKGVGPVKIGDKLTAFIEGKKMLDLNIR
jgi:2-keto-4-pentenoate hydratase/2-oxohepta-3-ene-1,7-dioic acid hydratase in catechol pathway